MQNKYAPNKSRARIRTRRRTPEYWKSGPDPLQHEMYYAWAKHRSQAHYRGESYDLTFEDWQEIWSNPEDFLRRGRKPDDLTLTRRDPELPWTLDNCEVLLRLDQLRREIARRGGKIS